MVNLKDLILYENENTGLDFKAIQYTSDKYQDLIKDVMSMANADFESNRYIIIGVKLRNNGEREFLGINKDEFIDQANYQQIIRENIEPDIPLEYFPYDVNGVSLGVFCISNCEDKPYMMRKDYGKLKKGGSFIRKGSHQSPMIRADLDRIYEEKAKLNAFNGEVKISFSINDLDQIELSTIGDIELPSHRAAKNISQIIEERRNASVIDAQKNAMDDLQAKAIATLTGVLPYENRSIEVLEENLINVKKDYIEDDFYELFELNSIKLNFNILNHSTKYIEDALFIVEFPNEEGLLIADQVYDKPKHGYKISDPYELPNFENSSYPQVDHQESSIIIMSNIGDIRHHILTQALKKPIRIVLANKLSGHEIMVKCKLHGKNLYEPIERTLKIKVSSGSKKD